MYARRLANLDPMRAPCPPSPPRRWLAPIGELTAFALVLVAAAKLGSLTGWDNQRGYLALRTPYWPFYVLSLHPPAWSGRVVFPLLALVIAEVALRPWLGEQRGRRSALVAVAVAAWLFHLALAVEHLGVVAALSDTFERPGMEYWQDVALVHAGFLRHFPEIGALSIHGVTHPPGLTLVLAGVQALGLRDAHEAELLCSGAAALTALPLYGAARRLGGEAAARSATALFLFACSVSAFAVLAMDTVTMLLATIALYGLCRALDGEVIGGAILGLGLFAASLCNFVALLMPLSFALLILSRWSQRRQMVRPMAIGVAIFFAAYALMWLGFGYRPLHVLDSCAAMLRRSTDRLRSRNAALLGTPVAFLGALGLPLGALAARAIGGAVARLVRRRATATALVVLAGAAPWALGAALGKPRGEVEHAYLLFVPMMVIAAAVAAHQWYQRDGRWVARVAIPMLALQSIAIEVYLSTYW
jgi:hypothetical protein